MKIVITSDERKVYIEFNDEMVDECKFATINKTSVGRVLLKNNPLIGDIVIIVYDNDRRDEIHYSKIETINGQTVENNLDLYNILRAIL